MHAVFPRIWAAKSSNDSAYRPSRGGR